ncbi:MAG TPA: HAD family hydrolase, partial [Nocardioides sp.]|nr:HAD family hydrolase [Nocardioides sp.]
MTPRLVATDLDGTLLRSDGTVSERSREVLAALDRRGVPVVIVTGRPMRWLGDLLPIVGGHGLAIVSNGAAVYDVAAGRARDVRGIEPRAGLVLAER